MCLIHISKPAHGTNCTVYHIQKIQYNYRRVLHNKHITLDLITFIITLLRVYLEIADITLHSKCIQCQLDN